MNTLSVSPSVIQNPVLKGFNPDPSILRVGKDYYIANSTFEWFPGGNWKPIGPTLNGAVLSDDYSHLGFTGAFVGLCCQDLSGQRLAADFSRFTYSENPH